MKKQAQNETYDDGSALWISCLVVWWWSYTVAPLNVVGPLLYYCWLFNVFVSFLCGLVGLWVIRMQALLLVPFSHCELQDICLYFFFSDDKINKCEME